MNLSKIFLLSKKFDSVPLWFSKMIKEKSMFNPIYSLSQKKGYLMLSPSSINAKKKISSRH